MSSEPDSHNKFEALLTPTVRVRSSDDVVSQLRDILLSGEIKPNDRLPSERELSRILGVGRTTVREALRNLEAHGLVDIRLGGTGGAFFHGPDPGVVGSALSMLLMFEATTATDLSEFRLGFEQENAELAVERATEAEVTELEALLARVESVTTGPDIATDWRTIEQLDLEMHELLPILTHNTVRIAISRGIHDALRRSFEAIEPQTSSPAALQSEVIELLKLLISRDAHGARNAMAEHLIAWQR